MFKVFTRLSNFVLCTIVSGGLSFLRRCLAAPPEPIFIAFGAPKAHT
jgi:hypothetical protein